MVDSLDRNLHTYNDEYITHIRTATQVSVLSLRDIGCNSEQVKTLADHFLDYDKDTGDVNAQPEDISLTEIVDYVSTDRPHTSDSDTDSHILEITPPTTISVGLANTYLTEISNLLERFPVDTLQTTGQPLPIFTAVQHLWKIQQGFHHYEESKKKQGTLTNWLQIGSTKTKEMESIMLAHHSQTPEPAHPVFPTVQSVRLESGRGRTTFCRPVPSSTQIARRFRVEDVRPRSHLPSY